MKSFRVELLPLPDSSRNGRVALEENTSLNCERPCDSCHIPWNVADDAEETRFTFRSRRAAGIPSVTLSVSDERRQNTEDRDGPSIKSDLST